jgi:ATP/ADP translocase
MHRSIWEEAFIPVDPTERSTVKIVVDGVAARIAEAVGAIAILLWLKQTAPDGVLPMPLDTNWIDWVPLATVAVWLLITQRMRVQIKEDRAEIRTTPSREIKCERFPDQCPCTTELGKGGA